jgi:glycine oxidase
VTEVHYGEEGLLRLNLESAARYPDFVAELEETSGLDVGYRRTGTLMIARDTDDEAALDRLLAFQQDLGLAVERLDAPECRARVPGLSRRTRGGIFIAGDHQVDNRALVAALLVACEGAGVRLVEGRVTAVRGDHKVTGVATERQGDFDCGSVVIAAGSWSGEIELPPDVALPLRPVKGQLLHLRGPAPILEHNLRGLDVYLVPRSDGRLVVGATMEERGMDLQRTAEAAYLLLRDAYELLPGVLELELVEHSSGLRPATPDNAPLIGLSSVEGLLFATGHFRNGILLAPVTADAIEATISTGRAPSEIEAFSPGRFSATRERV